MSARTSITFGVWEGHRRAVCACGWVGDSRGSRRLAEEDADAHVCESLAVPTAPVRECLCVLCGEVIRAGHLPHGGPQCRHLACQVEEWKRERDERP